MDLFEYAQEAPTKEDKKTPKDVYSVSQVTSEIKHLLAQHFLPKHPITIEGEVSNYRGRNSAGHMYFSLKDAGAILPCVFFRFANAKCKVDFSEGSLVQVKGKIEVYEKGGKYQLVIESLSIKGQGSLYEKFLKVKEKLELEGLFDPKHKKEIPAFPKRIGVVTSSTGSVIRDIIHVIENRAPVVDIVLFSSKVQGDGAAQNIKAQIELAQKKEFNLDVIIVGRGGGSIEDLWAFNEEVLARAVFASSVPIISAVGHQTDFTICDFVADVRAATPSQAAEFAVPNIFELRNQMKGMLAQVYREVINRMDQKKQLLARWMGSPMMKDPRSSLHQRMQYLDDLQSRLREQIKHVMPLRSQKFTSLQKDFIAYQTNALLERQAKLKSLTNQLKVLDPQNVLSRGYSIVKTKDQKVISGRKQVKVKQELEVQLSDGAFECIVSKI